MIKTRFLLEWSDHDKERFALIDVTEYEYDEENEEERLIGRWIDLSQFDEEADRWRTKEIISEVKVYHGVGLPSNLNSI